MTKVVFGNGAAIETAGEARGIVELFASIAGGKRGNDHGQPLPIGYASINTDHGPVYVNVSQVAYVRD